MLGVLWGGEILVGVRLLLLLLLLVVMRAHLRRDFEVRREWLVVLLLHRLGRRRRAHAAQLIRYTAKRSSVGFIFREQLFEVHVEARCRAARLLEVPCRLVP